MIRFFYFSLIFFLFICSLIYVCYIQSLQVVFSCSGIYRTEYSKEGKSITNISNILVTVKKDRTIEFEAHGVLRNGDVLYHINREYEFVYKMQDLRASIIKISLKKMTKGTSDSIPESDSMHVFSAIDGRDSLIRIWKISNYTVLIGNAFTPIFSCTLSQ